MVNVIVCGACGKMGTMIIETIHQQEIANDIRLVGAIERQDHLLIGTNVNNDGCIFISSDLEEIIDKADVIIDFTNPVSTVEHLKIATQKGKGMVIGTTGLEESQILELKKSSSVIPIVFSPNMSIGVNLLFKLVKDAAKILGDDYEVEIIEAHHNHKKDSPSGTALKLGKIIAEGLNRDFKKVAVYGRKGTGDARKKEEIGILAVRAGDIIGEHTVMFCAEGERLELIHRAHNRFTFAQGSVRAARFIAGASPGLYEMKDVLEK